MEIFEYFDIPSSAIPQLSNNNRIAIKQLIEMSELVGSDKRLIEKSIGMISVKALINEQSSSIWSYNDENYNYDEIQMFYVNLKDKTHISKVNELLHSIFPNPCLFIYQCETKYAISTALKRINKLDNSKSVIEEIQLSNLFELKGQYIELLKKHSNRFNNLKEYYEFLNNLVAVEEVLNLTGKIPNVIDGNSKKYANEIKHLLKTKRDLESQYNDADSMREKMSIHMKIMDIDEKLKGI